MTKIELVQASVNLSNGIIIYSFKLKYPKKHWANVFGYSSNETTTAEATCITNYFTFIKDVARECDPSVLNEVITKVHKYATFASKVLAAIYNKRVVGRIGKADADRAVELFGTRAQYV